MSFVFTFVGLISILAGAITYLSTRKKEDKGKIGKAILITGAVVWLIGVIIPSGGNDTASSNEDLTTEEKIEESLDDWELREFKENDDNTVYVEAFANESWSKDTLKNSILINMADIAEILKGENYNRIDIDFYTSLVDQYGNAEDGSVLRTAFTKEIMDKIDFENFNPENIPEVTVDYWEHDLFNRE
ncbi:hypothetical protein [Gracilibacillus thailandensis]|uniref:Uncharacterized protein n=1 Tax=Gracilibacillus thailandensis TaxID=563735 RepID=A0A6N7QSW8_9BACI|nr:hypothetical protein [Gracilibacillus thailandensis]MRI65108.1 hypothetical protein [Gracilibacillus thailandensis]